MLAFLMPIAKIIIMLKVVIFEMEVEYDHFAEHVLLKSRVFYIILCVLCSDIIVQIVDARNPLLFRCDDLVR